MRMLVPALCGVAGALIFAGCAGMLVRPAVNDVKTVALVSVYMNRHFYDIKNPHAAKSVDALELIEQAGFKDAKGHADNNDALRAAYQSIAACGARTYAAQLEGVGGWKWLPETDILGNTWFQKFVDSATGKHPKSALGRLADYIRPEEWYAPEGMIPIPLDGLTRNGRVIYAGPGKDPQQTMRLALIKLCKDLNVDAVAILQFDMAYKKPVQLSTIFEETSAAPSIAAALVLVNKDGNVAVNSGLVTKGAGKRFEGGTVKMLHNGSVRLDDNSVHACCEAIEASAQKMKQQLLKEFSKINQ